MSSPMTSPELPPSASPTPKNSAPISASRTTVLTLFLNISPFPRSTTEQNNGVRPVVPVRLHAPTVRALPGQFLYPAWGRACRGGYLPDWIILDELNTPYMAEISATATNPTIKP